MTVLSGALAGVLIGKFIIASFFDPIFYVGLIALFLYLKRIQSEHKAFKDAFHAFLYLVGGQCIALTIPLLLGFIFHLTGLPFPQSIVNLIGVIPLIIGIAELYDLVKDTAVMKRLKQPLLKTYETIGSGENNIITKHSKKALEVVSSLVKEPFMLEVVLFYLVCFTNSVAAYKSLFWWLDIFTCLSVIVTFNVMLFFKTLLVLIGIQWSKQYTDCLCPTECWEFFFPGDFFSGVPKYLNAGLLIVLGLSLLGQSIVHAVAPTTI